MKRSCFNLIIFCFILGSVSAFAQISGVDEKTPISDPLKDLVYPGDVIDIDVLGSTEYDWRGTLSPEGFLSGLDFIEEPVFARCKTERAIAEAVAAGYSKLLRDPKVVVRVVDRTKRPVSTIFGAVKKEQKFSIRRPVFLNELLVLSGGLTDRASGDIQIFRPREVSCAAAFQNLVTQNAEKDEREKFLPTSQTKGAEMLNFKISDLLRGREDSNPQIYSGDIITVLESDPIYIIGGVAVPKRISAREKTTLSRAIAGAGGFTKDSEPEKITIFRRDGEETKIIEANFDEIEKDPEKDIMLQPFDVIDVGVRGRGKSRLAPIVREEDFSGPKTADLPLRIID